MNRPVNIIDKQKNDIALFDAIERVLLIDVDESRVGVLGYFQGPGARPVKIAWQCILSVTVFLDATRR